jgi:hypothetical protein
MAVPAEHCPPAVDADHPPRACMNTVACAPEKPSRIEGKRVGRLPRNTLGAKARPKTRVSDPTGGVMAILQVDMAEEYAALVEGIGGFSWEDEEPVGSAIAAAMDPWTAVAIATLLIW